MYEFPPVVFLPTLPPPGRKGQLSPQLPSKKNTPEEALNDNPLSIKKAGS